MESREDQPSAVVTEDDKILFVGTYDEAKDLYGDAEVVDLGGKTLMPGFIDPHSHFFQTAQSIHMCDLSEAESFADIARILKEYQEKNPQMDVILASGYAFTDQTGAGYVFSLWYHDGTRGSGIKRWFYRLSGTGKKWIAQYGCRSLYHG